jgi:ribosomal protein S18 acetylase RimI-like enzyme
MRIVKATPADVPRLVPLFEGYRTFYGLQTDRTAVRRFLTQRIRRGEATVFLAVDDGSRDAPALGFTLLYPTFSSLQLRRAWVLNDLFVAADARRRGVARRLIERATRLAKSSGAAYLMLETAHTNRKAQRLYESLGWVWEREFRNYVRTIG